MLDVHWILSNTQAVQIAFTLDVHWIMYSSIQAGQIVFTLDLHWRFVEYPRWSDRFHGGGTLNFVFEYPGCSHRVRVFTLDFVEFPNCPGHFHAGCALDFCRVSRLLMLVLRWTRTEFLLSIQAGQVVFMLDAHLDFC